MQAEMNINNNHSNFNYTFTPMGLNMALEKYWKKMFFPLAKQVTAIQRITNKSDDDQFDGDDQNMNEEGVGGHLYKRLAKLAQTIDTQITDGIYVEGNNLLSKRRYNENVDAYNHLTQSRANHGV